MPRRDLSREGVGHIANSGVLLAITLDKIVQYFFNLDSPPAIPIDLLAFHGNKKMACRTPRKPMSFDRGRI